MPKCHQVTRFLVLISPLRMIIRSVQLLPSSTFDLWSMLATRDVERVRCWFFSQITPLITQQTAVDNESSAWTASVCVNCIELSRSPKPSHSYDFRFSFNAIFNDLFKPRAMTNRQPSRCYGLAQEAKLSPTARLTPIKTVSRGRLKHPKSRDMKVNCETVETDSLAAQQAIYCASILDVIFRVEYFVCQFILFR